jgi:glycosyltransferase involved in cell wall biosynthesis
MKEFSIIIPVFNSESCLQDSVSAVTIAMESFNENYEIILVDDGSKDKSWEIIKQLKSINPKIIGVKLNKNYGQHNAILCGLNISCGNYIVTLDDDLEQNPEDISKLYKQLVAAEADLVYGMPEKSKKSILRKILRYFYKHGTRNENKNAGEGSSFRLFNKKLKDEMTQHQGSLFFLDEIALWYTGKPEYIKVDFQKSKKINSGYTYSSLFDLSLRIVTLSSTMPLRMLRVVGLYIFGLSLFSGSYFIIRKFLFKVPLGYTSLMVVILFSTGIITLTLGVIGEYLGNLIALSNNRPAYSVKEKV